MVGLALIPTPQCHTLPQVCSVPAVWMGKGSLVHAQGLAAAALLTLPKRNNSAQGTALGRLELRYLLIAPLCDLNQVTLPLFLSQVFHPGKLFGEGASISQRDAEHQGQWGF